MLRGLQGREALLTTRPLQIDRYAQQDLKKGLHLYGTPGNVGLTNAWSIIQTDVRGMAEGVGRPPVGCWVCGGALSEVPTSVMMGRAPSSPGRHLLVPPAVPLLRCLQLHGLVRGLQRHARARLLLPGVQRELRAARTWHLVEGGEPAPAPPVCWSGPRTWG